MSKIIESMVRAAADQPGITTKKNYLVITHEGGKANYHFNGKKQRLMEALFEMFADNRDMMNHFVAHTYAVRKTQSSN